MNWSLSGFVQKKTSSRNLSSGLIIAALFLSSSFLGFKLYQFVGPQGLAIPSWFFLLVGGLAATAVALLALRSMADAITLLVVTSAIVNITISTGTKSPINATIILVVVFAAVWIFRMIAAEKRLWLVPAPTNVLLLGFLLMVLLAWVGGYAIPGWRASFPSNAFQVQAGQFAMFALSAAALLLTANHFLKEVTLKRWTLIIIVLGAMGIGADVVGISPNPLPAVKGGMQMWPFVLLFAQLLFNPDLKAKHHFIGWPILILWVYWVFFTNTLRTKGLWVPALFAMGILLCVRSVRWFLATGALGALMIVSTGTLGRIIANETASSYRPLIWLDVIRMTSKNWLLGLGPANYMYYWPSLGLDSEALQEALRRQPWMAARWATYITVPSHNMFVDIFAQSGLVGLLLFLAFLVVALRFAWHLARRLQPGFLQAHAYAVFCGFASLSIGSFFFADWLLPFVYNISIRGFQHSVYSWLLLGTLVSIDYFLIKES
jgi:O-antigen ligase